MSLRLCATLIVGIENVAIRRTHALGGREPKIPVPTRTLPLPAMMACSKSADIPMLSSSLPPTPQLPPTPSLPSNTSLHSINEKKSGFSEPASVDASYDPMVINPRSFSRGQSLMTWVDRSSSSLDEPEVGDERVRGAIPDLLSSPDVLTCR